MTDKQIFAFMAGLVAFALCIRFSCAEIGIDGFYSVTESGEMAQYGGYFSASGDDSKIKISGSKKQISDETSGKCSISYARLLENVFYKTRTAWNGGRGELSGGIDAGYSFPAINVSIGYEMSQIDELHHMGALKFDIPVGKMLKYSFHNRTDFGISGSRDWEWWQQVEFFAPLKYYDIGIIDFRHQLRVIYQLDRQYGFTEKEFKLQFVLQGA